MSDKMRKEKAEEMMRKFVAVMHFDEVEDDSDNSEA